MRRTRNRQLRPEIDLMLNRAMVKDADERYPAALAFVESLQGRRRERHFLGRSNPPSAFLEGTD